MFRISTLLVRMNSSSSRAAEYCRCKCTQNKESSKTRTFSSTQTSSRKIPSAHNNPLNLMFFNVIKSPILKAPAKRKCYKTIHDIIVGGTDRKLGSCPLFGNHLEEQNHRFQNGFLVVSLFIPSPFL
jgi:hypothetical protein